MLKKYWLPVLLGTLILTVNVIRFIDLGRIPNGFMFDEETSGVTLQCLIEEGTSPLDPRPRYPLFADVGIGSPKPPTYLYPGMLWTKVFGFSEGPVRGFTVFAFIIALLGLFAIGRYWGGNTCGLWTMLAGTLSPWTWTYTRVGWESPLVLTFFIWAFFVALQAKQTWHFILSGILFSAAAYTYPPARMQIPLFLVLLSLFGLVCLKWKKTDLAAAAAAFIITSIPLLHAMITDPALSVRFDAVSLTNPAYLAKIGRSDSWPDILSMVFGNFLAHLTPEYLFFKGIPRDLGVSTGRQGIISWLDTAAILMGLFWIARAMYRKRSVAQPTTLIFFVFLAINILIGMLPSVITAPEIQGTGNPLRSIQSWPFAMIATGLIISKITTQWTWAAGIPLLTSIAFSCVFLTQYFTHYKNESVWIFRKWSLEEAKAARSTEEWMNFLYRHQEDRFASRYFLMRYRGDSCLEAKKTQENLNPLFKKIWADIKAKKNNP